MVKVNFNLRNLQADTPTPINMVIRYNNQRLVYPTEKSILPEYWNAKEQHAKRTSKFPEYPELNTRLDMLKSMVSKVVSKYQNEYNNKVPTISELRNLLNDTLHNTAAEKIKYNLFTFIENELKNAPKRISPRTGKPMQKITITAYKQTFTHLKEYCKARKRRLDFNDITIDFCNDFTHYFTHETDKKVNTAGKHLRNMKTFMQWSFAAKLHGNTDFQQAAFKIVNEKSDAIYLNEKELIALHNFDFSQSPMLDNARDLFLVGCYTGLRYSDFSAIKSHHFIKEDEIEYLQLEMKKTGATVSIPLHPSLRVIMNKYNGKTAISLPRSISNQKLNEFLKMIGQKVDFLKDTFPNTYSVKGKKITKDVPKWEKLTTHTARRSFATNLYLETKTLI